MYRPAPSKTSIMITLLVDNCNNFSQEFYDSVVFSIQLHQLQCSCGRSGCLRVHAYYHRTVRTPESRVKLRIMRVKCSECNRTHAILLSSIVPYSQISLETQRSIVVSLENGSDPMSVCTPADAIDENDVKHVVRVYRKFWREKLLSERIGTTEILEMIRRCFACFAAQFMQIRSGANLLFSNTT